MGRIAGRAQAQQLDEGMVVAMPAGADVADDLQLMVVEVKGDGACMAVEGINCAAVDFGQGLDCFGGQPALASLQGAERAGGKVDAVINQTGRRLLDRHAGILTRTPDILPD